jgi:hypothetical protein
MLRKRYRYLEARKYLGVRKTTFDRLIERGILAPDGKLPDGKLFWYGETLDRSPIKGLNYTQSGR